METAARKRRPFYFYAKGELEESAAAHEDDIRLLRLRALIRFGEERLRGFLGDRCGFRDAEHCAEGCERGKGQDDERAERQGVHAAMVALPHVLANDNRGYADVLSTGIQGTLSAICRTRSRFSFMNRA